MSAYNNKDGLTEEVRSWLNEHYGSDDDTIWFPRIYDEIKRKFHLTLNDSKQIVRQWYSDI